MKNKKLLKPSFDKEKLNIAISAGRLGTWEWNIKTGKVNWSEALEKIHGLKKDQFGGTIEDFHQNVHPEDFKKVKAEIEKSLANNRKYKVEYRIIIPDGSVRWLEARGLVITDSEGKPSRMLGVCLDITSSKENEERLKIQFIISRELAKAKSIEQISQRVLKLLSQTFGWHVGVLWLFDDESQNLRLNGVWVDGNKNIDIFKRENFELGSNKGKGLVGEVFRRNRSFWVKTIDKSRYRRRKLLADAGLKSAFLFPIGTSEKVVGVLELYSRYKREKDMGMIAMLGTIKNSIGYVIEKQIAQKEKDIYRKQLEIIFKTVPFGITVEDKKGKIVFANHSTAQIFGFKSSSDLIGENIETVFRRYQIIDEHGVELKFENRLAARIFKGTDDLSETLHFIKRKDRTEMWLLVRATAVKILRQEAHLVIKSFQDITKTVEDQKQRELFIGVVSHELKSPLASIKAFTQLLIRRLENAPDGKVPYYLENINNQTDRLTKIIADVLDVTRLTSGTFQLNKRVFNLDNVVDKTIENFRPIAKDFHLERKGKIGINFLGDEDRIVQILNNLLTNAIEHSGNSKKIEISTNKNGEYLEIAVRDFGVGIPKKHHEEVFRLFSRIPKKVSKRSSVGMGLSISQALAKSHGGEIKLESKPNMGAKFTIRLPYRSG